jgi:hypothetical protein
MKSTRALAPEEESATNPRVPHPPGFPVRLGGVNELHAAFLIESRTRCHGWGRAVGNPGSFAFFAKGGIPRISTPTVAPVPSFSAACLAPGVCFSPISPESRVFPQPCYAGLPWVPSAPHGVHLEEYKARPHVRAVHGSNPTPPPTERRLFLLQYRAADARSRRIRTCWCPPPGQSSRGCGAGDRAPAAAQGSIYENQKGLKRRCFENMTLQPVK